MKELKLFYFNMKLLLNYFVLDLNECGIQNGGCEQMCNNKVGGYLCTCRKGFGRKKNNPYGCESKYIR